MSTIRAFLASAVPAEKKPRQRRGGTGHLLPIEVAVDDAERRAGSGEWQGASGKTLVGLYAFCHRLVYRIIPDELRELPQFRMAAKQAATFTHNHFNDDFAAAAAFVKWAWEREKKKDIWALEQGIERNRMSWRWQFSAGLITDWKVGKSRRR